MRGALIVLEGAEGVGKTTQARRLAAALTHSGRSAQVIREPGGTALGESVRELLLSPTNDIAPAAEALLFMASRAQLVHDVVLPALTSGTTVVLDRFFLSTYAYQIAGRGLASDDVRAANHLATGGLTPDATVVLELPVQDGLARAAARGAGDRMELAETAFHERVAAAFGEFTSPAWQAAHPECGAIVAVQAAGTEEDVTARILAAVTTMVPALAAPGESLVESGR